MHTGSFLGFLPPFRLGFCGWAVADGTMTGPLPNTFSGTAAGIETEGAGDTE